MENEPFLASQTRPQLQPIIEHQDISFSFKLPQSQDPQSSSSSQLGAPSTRMKKPGGLHRCKTAPAMAVMRELKPETPQIPKPQSEESSSVIRAFKTLPGRLFAAVWLLFSTLMAARAFLYLAEARIDKRHRRIANWVLHRDITVGDLLAADINNDGFISKSEYVIYKLKEMGKIEEKDILQICNHFSKLDPNNSGKITLPHLLENRL